LGKLPANYVFKTVKRRGIMFGLRLDAVASQTRAIGPPTAQRRNRNRKHLKSDWGPGNRFVSVRSSVPAVETVDRSNLFLKVIKDESQTPP
jgi:hypothetical protein